ncbi:hypothetical protein [Paenibacillus phytohabitans]|uniref:hypothetical protein n=1 Tax=Paenibacillus phytohabitans TaxID=2654978 RepID=UPI00300B35D0
MYQQFIDSFQHVQEWVGQVPWSEIYHQAKNAISFANDILEFALIAKVSKPNETLPPKDYTPPYPHVPFSRRRRKPQTKYRNRNFRKRK